MFSFSVAVNRKITDRFPCTKMPTGMFFFHHNVKRFDIKKCPFCVSYFRLYVFLESVLLLCTPLVSGIGSSCIGCLDGED